MTTKALSLAAAAKEAIAFARGAGCEHLTTPKSLVSELESFVEDVRDEGEDEASNLQLFDGSSPGWCVAMVLRKTKLELSFHVIDSEYPREVAHWIEGEGGRLKPPKFLDGFAKRWGKPFLRCIVSVP